MAIRAAAAGVPIAKLDFTRENQERELQLLAPAFSYNVVGQLG
ncbi:hypothetical protein [Paenibacillus periandrae]|nr:hypothetical protein [Paenibacillus periandrae]